MDFLRLLLCILYFISVSLASSKEVIKIIETNPTKALVKEGNSIILSCRPSHPWFLCLWVHPSGRKACSIQDGGEHRSVCSGLENTEVVAVEDRCQLEIKNITVADHGMYMCLFSQAGVFHTDREHVMVEVATPAEITVRMAGVVEEREQHQLDLLEGEQVQLVCSATAGFPAPQFSWRIIPDNDGIASKFLPVNLESTMVNTSSYLNYTASTSHSGWTIQCLARQVDGEKVLYSSWQNLSLTVTKAEPLYADMTSQQGVLTGIFMSSILVILCITAVLIFLLKRSKKSVMSTDLKPITKQAIWSPHGDIKAESLYSRPSDSTRQSSMEECMVEMPGSSSSSAVTNTPPQSICSSPSLNRTQSVGDIVEGNFISFSPSDMYSRAPTMLNIGTVNVEESEIISDDSFKTSTLLSSTSQPGEVSGVGQWDGGSEGGVSVISVFDCQHGCFNPEHSFPHCDQHLYLE